MKTLLLFLFLLLLAASACISNDQETIDRILASDSFTITEESTGCFGPSMTSYIIYTVDNRRFVQTTASTGRANKHSITEFNSSKEDTLRKFMNEGIRGNLAGSCTTSSTYRIRAGWHRVKFIDGSCRGFDYLGVLSENPL